MDKINFLFNFGENLQRKITGEMFWCNLDEKKKRVILANYQKN